MRKNWHHLPPPWLPSVTQGKNDTWRFCPIVRGVVYGYGWVNRKLYLAIFSGRTMVTCYNILSVDDVKEQVMEYHRKSLPEKCYRTLEEAYQQIKEKDV